MNRFIFALLITIVFASQASATKEPFIGHAAFFYLSSPDQEAAVYDDFSYYLNGINPWLTDKRIAVSYHSKAPFELQLASGQKLNFVSKDLELDLGLILAKPDGRFKAYYGVSTGIDIMELVKDFFDKEAL